MFFTSFLDSGRLDVTPWDMKLPRLLLRSQVRATRFTFDWFFDPSKIEELLSFKVEVLDSDGVIVRKIDSTYPPSSTTIQFVPKEGKAYFLRCAAIPKIGGHCEIALEDVHVESLVNETVEVENLNSGKKRIHEEIISRDRIWTS
jgi:hypothetical protein